MRLQMETISERMQEREKEVGGLKGQVEALQRVIAENKKQIEGQVKQVITAQVAAKKLRNDLKGKDIAINELKKN